MLGQRNSSPTHLKLGPRLIHTSLSAGAKFWMLERSGAPDTATFVSALVSREAEAEQQILRELGQRNTTPTQFKLRPRLSNTYIWIGADIQRLERFGARDTALLALSESGVE